MIYFIEININQLHVIKLTLVVELHLSEKVIFVIHQQPIRTLFAYYLLITHYSESILRSVYFSEYNKYSNKSYLKIHIYWRNLSKETIKIQNYDKEMSKLCCTVCLTHLLHLTKIKIYEIWLSAILKHLFDLIDQFKVVFVKSAYFFKNQRTLFY